MAFETQKITSIYFELAVADEKTQEKVRMLAQK
jgi:hypothetical protein